MTLDTLIDKSDNFEIVRDQVAAILSDEVANQMALATAAGKDSALWAFSVYLERFRPWEAAKDVPLVNVSYDNSTFPGNKGDTVERQTSETTINIDCYGQANSKQLGAGYSSGDELAARELQRVIRLVRNILMAGENTYLQLRGVVVRRAIQGITQFQPAQSDRHVENLIAARVVLRVEFNEFSPQVTPETLEMVQIETTRAEDGRVIAVSEFDYT